MSKMVKLILLALIACLIGGSAMRDAYRTLRVNSARFQQRREQLQ